MFAVEQQCVYTDLDGRDCEAATRHLWIDGDPAAPTVSASLRVLAQPDGSPKIGRIATAPAARSQGLASRLIDAALDVIGLGGVVVLDAQVRLASWYGRWGFERSGPDFDEDGIRHTPMRRLGLPVVVIRPPADPISLRRPKNR